MVQELIVPQRLCVDQGLEAMCEHEEDHVHIGRPDFLELC